MKAVRVIRAALVAGGVLALLSCTDASRAPVGIDPAPRPDALFGWPLPPPPTVGLLTCEPLPYDSVTQTIGPEGGSLSVAGHTLWVPAGAFDTAVTITAIAPSDTIRHIRFEPEGLQFQQAAWLRMSYAGCSLLGSLAPKRIAYTDDLFAILEYLPSFDDLIGQTVTGQLRHFSEYAIAW
jgi:hypothetical protein